MQKTKTMSFNIWCVCVLSVVCSRSVWINIRIYFVLVYGEWLAVYWWAFVVLSQRIVSYSHTTWHEFACGFEYHVIWFKNSQRYLAIQNRQNKFSRNKKHTIEWEDERRVYGFRLIVMDNKGEKKILLGDICVTSPMCKLIQLTLLTISSKTFICCPLQHGKFEIMK